MNDPSPDPVPAASPAAASRTWTWWVRAVEVRLRFVFLVLAVLVVTTQWARLRGAWDDLRQKLWSSERTASVSGDREYFCPMDPGVISVWPAICPICNMDLVQRRKHDAQLLPEGVIARMQLSPYRIQLAGIRTREVTPKTLVEEVPFVGTIAEGRLLSASISREEARDFSWPLTARLHPAGRANDTVEVTLHADETAGVSPTLRWEPASTVPDWLAPGTVVRGEIQVPRKLAAAPGEGSSSTAESLAVPESAVVDHGVRQLVFVESMPGMFDAREVTLGRRCGDWYPVEAGLKAGERIAEAGAFLIDAETRLNPSLAVAYFGANQANSTSRAPQVTVADPKGTPALSAEDAALARAQSVCPVTDLSLDSMGGPVAMVVEGRKVFLCCKGCEGKLKREPAKYLAKLPPP